MLMIKKYFKHHTAKDAQFTYIKNIEYDYHLLGQAWTRLRMFVETGFTMSKKSSGIF